jgi:hypothetical protein
VSVQADVAEERIAEMTTVRQQGDIFGVGRGGLVMTWRIGDRVQGLSATAGAAD